MKAPSSAPEIMRQMHDDLQILTASVKRLAARLEEIDHVLKGPIKLRNDPRKRPIPPPPVLTLAEVERKLGQTVSEDAIAAGWLKHRCEKVTASREKPRRLFSLEDVESVEDRILCGEYPQPK